MLTPIPLQFQHAEQAVYQYFARVARMVGSLDSQYIDRGVDSIGTHLQFPGASSRYFTASDFAMTTIDPFRGEEIVTYSQPLVLDTLEYHSHQ